MKCRVLSFCGENSLVNGTPVSGGGGCLASAIGDLCFSLSLAVFHYMSSKCWSRLRSVVQQLVQSNVDNVCPVPWIFIIICGGGGQIGKL